MDVIPDQWTVVIAGSVILGLGVAPASTLSTDLIVGAAPTERAGAASAISEAGGELCRTEAGDNGRGSPGSLATWVVSHRGRARVS
ncbi:MFS transporter [Streptosporangium soli]|nr:hypothetical protein [Streptosporangium sp. KLBMP 9127]MCG5220797.1 hypothetical protein [Streptosporangium sp. KLBMP 9127]